MGFTSLSKNWLAFLWEKRSGCCHFAGGVATPFREGTNYQAQGLRGSVQDGRHEIPWRERTSSVRLGRF